MKADDANYSQTLEIEIAYANLANQQFVERFEVRPGVTLRGAIERSRILDKFPEIDLAINRVGVFGRLKSLEDPVMAGDRIEIYRPLIADPKEMRRKKAQQKKEQEK